MAEKFNASVSLKNLLENCKKTNHRCILPIVQPSNENVVIIHHLLSKISSEQPDVLWCHGRDYKPPNKNHRRYQDLKKKITNKQINISSDNVFDIFILSTPIKFCSYDETQKILGNTYKMCILQDFECLTPNCICRIIEAVSGGGVIVICLPDKKDIRSVFNLPMKVHDKLKVYEHSVIEPHFNERLLISFGWCKNCIILDNNLQVSSEKICGVKDEIVPVNDVKNYEETSELQDVINSLKDADKPLPELVGLCKTADQAKAVLKMIDVIADKNGKSTVAISAGRGRGKSAAMGIAVSAGVYHGYGNIFIVSPSPENLKTFFNFILKGFDALNYKENSDYEIFQSLNPEFKSSIIKITIFNKHRQIIQYVDPQDYKKISQAELVVIDEAASIPLEKVKELFGPHNVFMASTINGYEGTGRSLSLKLLMQLRQQSKPSGTVATSSNPEDTLYTNCRPLHEVTMESSIRYSPNDPVEIWLNKLFCLDATSYIPPVFNCPPPSSCELYYVNKKVLLSGHKDTEKFLHQVLSLLVSSHYRNSPDDLQILSDAPAHHLFVLLPPLPKEGNTAIPPTFCVIQVCFEGGIPKSVSSEHLYDSKKPHGDLIPWLLAGQFSMAKLTKYNSIRIVRIATHPDYQSMGYGSRAMELLMNYFKKEFISLDEINANSTEKSSPAHSANPIGPRKHNVPLLMKLSERIPEEIDYIGVSFGLTDSLFKFWQKLHFIPLYVSQSLNKITGEHNCVVVNPLHFKESCNEEESLEPLPKWLLTPCEDFMQRFIILLGGPFKYLNPQLVLRILLSHSKQIHSKEEDWTTVKLLINGHDLQRLESYSKNLSDRHLIMDLLPSMASLFFKKQLPNVHLSAIQSSLLIGTGFQRRSLDEIAKTLSMPIESVLGQFNRAIRRLLSRFNDLQQREIAKYLPKKEDHLDTFKPVDITLEQEWNEAAEEFDDTELRKTAFGDVRSYSIKGDDSYWQEALKDGDAPSHIVIKSKKRQPQMTEEELEKELAHPKEQKKSKSKRRKKTPIKK